MKTDQNKQETKDVTIIQNGLFGYIKRGIEKKEKVPYIVSMVTKSYLWEHLKVFIALIGTIGL